MTEFTHTPAPWRVIEGHHGMPEVWDDAIETCVADRVFNDNATLIAAAPELLNACMSLVNYLDEFCDEMTYNSDVVMAARVVICKATDNPLWRDTFRK